jgi:hypothetical protein
METAHGSNMGKSAPETPPAPNAQAVAQAQTTSNQQTAQYQSQLNNGNSYGPYGSVTNTYNPTANQWTQDTTLSPQEQAIFNSGTQAQGTALGLANTQLGKVGTALGQTLTAPSAQTSAAGGPIASSFNPGQQVQGQVGNDNINQSVSNAENANFAGQMQLLQPQMQQASEQQNANLIAQGLNPNDAAYQNSQTLFGNQQATQLGQAASSAVAAGNAEQNTLFGQQLGQGEFANQAAGQEYAQNEGLAGFGNTAESQQFGQNTTNAQLYNSGVQQNFADQATAQETPINEFDALMSSGQVTAPQTASLNQAGVAPTDVTGAYALQQQAEQADYQSQMQQYESGLGGLFNLGSAALLAA